MPFSGDRVGHFSLNTRRVFVGIAAIPCVASLVNQYFNLGLFGKFGRSVVSISFFFMILVMRYLGPTMDDMKKYRGRS